MHLSHFTLALAFVFLTGFRHTYSRVAGLAHNEGNSRRFKMWASLYDAMTLPSYYFHELSHMLVITLTGGFGRACVRTELVRNDSGLYDMTTGAASIGHSNSLAMLLSAMAPLWLFGFTGLIFWTQFDFNTLLPAPLAFLASSLTLAWLMHGCMLSGPDWIIVRNNLVGAIWFVAGFVALGVAIHAAVNYKPAAQAPVSASASAAAKAKHVPTKLLPAQPAKAASKVE